MLAALVAPGALAAASCSIAASGVAFGVYNPFSPTALTTTGTLTATCTQIGNGQTQVAMTVSLSTGSSGSFAARTLVSGSGTLLYNLYLSAAYTQVWGDGTGGSFASTANLHVTTGNPTQQVLNPIYALISAGQDADAGSYVDTIVVTVNY
jgi:spore coat protein U-like protein